MMTDTAKAVASAREWLAMTEALPFGTSGILRHPAICPSEIEAFKSLLSDLEAMQEALRRAAAVFDIYEDTEEATACRQALSKEPEA